MRHIQRDWVCCLLLAENISVQTRDTASETASARAQHAWCGGSAPFSSRCGVALRTVPRPPARAHCRVPTDRPGAFAQIVRAATQGRTASDSEAHGSESHPLAQLRPLESTRVAAGPDAGTAERGAAYSRLGHATLVAARGGGL